MAFTGLPVVRNEPRVNYAAPGCWLDWQGATASPVMDTIELPVETIRTYVEGAGGVSFPTCIDGCTVRCYVTQAALETYFGGDTRSPVDPCAASLRAFDRHSSFIGAMARNLLRRRGPEASAVVLTVDAVFRALTRRQ
jgi:Protein of unknown function (DUF1488)